MKFKESVDLTQKLASILDECGNDNFWERNHCLQQSLKNVMQSNNAIASFVWWSNTVSQGEKKSQMYEPSWMMSMIPTLYTTSCTPVSQGEKVKPHFIGTSLYKFTVVPQFLWNELALLHSKELHLYDFSPTTYSMHNWCTVCMFGIPSISMIWKIILGIVL
jgi:hypothetical protein